MMGKFFCLQQKKVTFNHIYQINLLFRSNFHQNHHDFNLVFFFSYYSLEFHTFYFSCIKMFKNDIIFD